MFLLSTLAEPTETVGREESLPFDDAEIDGNSDEDDENADKDDDYLLDEGEEEEDEVDEVDENSDGEDENTDKDGDEEHVNEQNSGEKQTLQVPKARKLYFDCNGFVDRANFQILFLSYPHRLYRWKGRSLLFIIRLIVHNSKILWNAKHPERILKTRFYLKELKTGLLTPRNPDFWNGQNHTSQSTTSRGRCIVCYDQGKKQTQTTSKCSLCEKFVHVKCIDLHRVSIQISKRFR